MKHLFLFLLLHPAATVIAQVEKFEKTPVPDSLVKGCNQLFIKDIGKMMFGQCLRFDSASGGTSTYAGGATRTDYTFYFTFSYPSTPEAVFPLTMSYVSHSGGRYFQSGRFLRMNRSDLPANLEKLGTKLISKQQAHSKAVKADPKVENVDGKFILLDNGFVWDFTAFYVEPNPKGDAETVLSRTVLIDPYSGKVIGATAR